MPSKNQDELGDRVTQLEKRLEVLERVVKRQNNNIKYGGIILLIMVALLAIVISLFLSLRENLRMGIDLNLKEHEDIV